MDYQPQMDFYRMDQMKFVCFKWFSTPLPSVALRLWPNAWKGEASLNPKATIEKAWSTQFFLEVFPYQFKDQSSYCQGTACPANGSPRNIGPAPTPWKASPKWSLGTAVFVQNLPKVSPVYWRFDLGLNHTCMSWLLLIQMTSGSGFIWNLETHKQHQNQPD